MPIFQVHRVLAGRFASLDVRSDGESMLNPRLLRFASHIAFVVGLIFLVSSALAVYRTSRALQLAVDSAKIQAASVIAPTLPRPSQTERDFVSELPITSPADLQIRFVAKLASEQNLDVVQMQSEPLKSEFGSLGQSRITLQLRGDYRGIKNVWIALLSKYPGLTLQRLTVRHHADAATAAAPSPAATTSPLPPADGADDEASIEMIQYTQPPALHR